MCIHILRLTLSKSVTPGLVFFSEDAASVAFQLKFTLLNL